MMKSFGIGGNEVPVDAGEAIADIPQNRTLLVEKLTSSIAIKPEVVTGLKTIDSVFDHFKPEQKIEFSKTDGSTTREVLNFKHLGNFGENGIVEQSEFLQSTKNKTEEYYSVMKNLKSNASFRKVLADPEKKEAVLDAFRAMIEEIDANSTK